MAHVGREFAGSRAFLPHVCRRGVPPVHMRGEFAGSQTRRTRWDRSENVKNAFVLRDGDCLANKHILLVDDVVTTGATSCACAHVLEQAHPAHISFACLAFVDDDR